MVKLKSIQRVNNAMLATTIKPPSSTKVGLFVTCLVNMFGPSIAYASIKLLEEA